MELADLVADSDICRAGRFALPICPNTGFWPYFFSIQYFILLKLILMTLLYALFAATASKLQTETDNIWKFQRYILVVDFAHRLPLPAPLSIFCYIYLLFKWLFRSLTCYWCRRRDQVVSVVRLAHNKCNISPFIY